MRNKLRGVQSRHVIGRADPGIGDATEIPFSDFIGEIGATFLQLIDTPNSYVGQSLQVVRVNIGETGLEFATISGGTGLTQPQVMAKIWMGI